MSFRSLVLFSLVFALACGSSRAQTPNDGAPPSSPAHTDSSQVASASTPVSPMPPAAMSLWGGGSFSTGEIIGNIPRSQLTLVGLRYTRSLGPLAPELAPKGPTITYTADLLPLVLLSIPPNTIPAPPPENKKNLEDWSPTLQRDLDTYGIGARPVGFRINFRPATHVQPFIAGSAGFVYFLRSVPDDRGKHLNFTVDAGVGLQVIVSSRFVLTAGYRYHHLSNGYRGQINPGVDANLLYLGLSLSR